ncbi:MFS transporter [Acidianus manzaensis]|uniref:Oxalate/formate antiport family MFS transporter n=1 Tax=Acidianus manzaensis TaxID=282676 RepID=A0A1W6K236_9CREN|nr:MFS transporter [Acidianus manzaensis]ARM76603.1 oxalate/formate antiport family MFS transporter [Acidianus manzaensis]
MNRSKFIAIGLLVMGFNSLYQYSWNALEPLLKSGLDVSIVQISLGFTLFSIFSSAFQPIGGHFADKHGPRGIGIISGILSAIGFLGTYFSPSLIFFLISWSIGSIGEGILYGISANLAMKWFRDKMALATGIVSMGFGLGSAIANPFISQAQNFRTVTLIIGLTEIILLPALMSFAEYPKNLAGQPPKQAILTLKFWLIYLSFVGAVVPLTMMSSELPIIAKTLPYQEVVILISIFPLLSGGLRPIFGKIADTLGITKTVVILNSLLTIGSALLLLGLIPESTILIGFAGGSMITLYFNVAGEIFGIRFSTVNSGILYTGKALGGILGSVVFAFLFVINTQISYIYSTICGLIGVTAMLTVILMTKQSRKI